MLWWCSLYVCSQLYLLSLYYVKLKFLHNQLHFIEVEFLRKCFKSRPPASQPASRLAPHVHMYATCMDIVSTSGPHACKVVKILMSWSRSSCFSSVAEAADMFDWSPRPCWNQFDLWLWWRQLTLCCNWNGIGRITCAKLYYKLLISVYG